MTIPDRLYGAPGDEYLDSDPFDVLDRMDPGDLIIEEWAVRPASDLLPVAATILEGITERVCEEVTEEAYGDLVDVCASPRVVALAEAMLAAIAEEMTYGMADRLVARHHVVWSGGDEPEPRIVRVEQVGT